MNLSPLPIQKFFDNNGKPLSGGRVFTYATGTTTKIASYDEDGAENTNPVVLDFRGEASILLDPELSYTFTLAPPGIDDPPTNPIWTRDDLQAADVGLRADLASDSFVSDGASLVTYRYPAELSVSRTAHQKFRERVSVFDLGVVGDGVTDDTDAMQYATEQTDQAELWIPRPARILVSDSIPRYNQSIIGCAKEYAVFDAGDGNFPIFVNAGHEFITGEMRRLGFIYNDGVKPTDAGTQSEQIAIFMETVSGRSPNYDLYEDIEVRGAWTAFKDTSGSYGSTLRSYFARACKIGFWKENGTTFHFDRCITGGDAVSEGPDLAFYMNNNLAFTFTSCASDRAAPGAGNAANDFRSMTSFTINGWDTEGNQITGADAALFSFLDSDGIFTAHVQHEDDFSESSSFVSKIKNDASSIVLVGHRGRFNSGVGELTMSGNGTYYGVLSVNAGKTTIVGGRWNEPTTGTGSPTKRTFHATGTARNYDIGVITDGTRGSNSHEIVSDYYEESAQSVSGLTTSPTSVLQVRRGIQGVQIQLLTTLTGTSNSTSFAFTIALPAALRPARIQNIPCQLVDNGVLVTGKMIIGTDGTMTFAKTFDSAAFTNSGVKAVYAQTFPPFSLD